MLFENPPGRMPSKELLEVATYYKNLSDPEKEVFKKCLSFQSKSVIFDILTLLDGVNRFSEDVNARFELNVIENGVKYQLNDPDGEFLHDIFNSEK
jgi:hypothetical protein